MCPHIGTEIVLCEFIIGLGTTTFRKPLIEKERDVWIPGKMHDTSLNVLFWIGNKNGYMIQDGVDLAAQRAIELPFFYGRFGFFGGLQF